MKQLKYLSLMLLCAAMVLSFPACSDDEHDETTEYSVYVFVNFLLADVDKVKVIEYDKNNVEVANHVIECSYGHGSGDYIANPRASMVKAFVNNRQVGTTLFLEIGSRYNSLSIDEDDL